MNNLAKNFVPVTPLSDEWHQLRNDNIGASEVAALFDACPYLTKLELYLRKRGEISDDYADNDRTFWGRTLEDAIANGAEDKLNWQLDVPGGIYLHPRIKGMSCTPDRMTDKGPVEIKNVDRMQYHNQWDNDEPPLHYLLQLQHQIACTQSPWGAIVALIGGNELKVFEYDRHDGVIAKIEQAIKDFWHCVENQKEPEAVGKDYDIIKDLYTSTGAEIDLTGDNELPMLCVTALDAAERKRRAEKEERAAKALIIQKIGDNEIARCAGFNLIAKTIKRSAYQVNESQYRQLKIKESTT